MSAFSFARVVAMGRMLRSDAMRRGDLTACALILSFAAAACGDGAKPQKGSTSEQSSAEASGSAVTSAGKPAGFRAQNFRDADQPGPAYLATPDQLLIIDVDGSTDVVGESLGIVQIEPLATGDLLVRSANGLARVSGRTITSITASVPATALELTAAADDDAWAVGKLAVHHFDGKDWVATPVLGIKGEPQLRDITVDARGVAWLAAGEDGLFEWDGTRWKRQAGVKGEVLDVAASKDGVFALLPTGFVEVKGGVVSELVKRNGADVKSGDIAVDGSWTMLLDDGGGSPSFSVGKGGAQTWADALSRFGPESVWFAVDGRARVWVASKRGIAVIGKDPPDTTIPLNPAVAGDLVAVEVIGRGPEKLPTEIGPSVSMPLPEGSIPLPSGSARQGTVSINADPGFADGVVPNASSVVAGMAAGFRRCYNRGLLENPNMKGSLRITTKIGPNGEVVSASASSGSGLSGTVVSCLTARVSSATFAKPNGGGATIIIPVSLLPQS
jgi:hypothetical protein